MKSDNKVLLEMIEQEIDSSQEIRKEPNDHEGGMARSELRDMIQNGLVLYKLLQKEDELPGWVSSYISLASDYIHSVTGYMTQEKEEEEPSDDELDTEIGG